MDLGKGTGHQHSNASTVGQTTCDISDTFEDLSIRNDRLIDVALGYLKRIFEYFIWVWHSEYSSGFSDASVE